jgi:hypothetical protein
MVSKINPGLGNYYRRALPDEPMFIILGRDPSAPKLLVEWADRRRRDIMKDLVDNSDKLEDDSEFFKVRRRELQQCTEADELAGRMVAWRNSNEGAWRDGAPPRPRLGDIDPALKEAVSDALRQSLAQMCMSGTAAISIVEHVVNSWSVGGFAVRRHYFRIQSEEKFEKLAGDNQPTLPDFDLTGYDATLGDVFLVYKDPSNIRVQLSIVEA